MQDKQIEFERYDIAKILADNFTKNDEGFDESDFEWCACQLQVAGYHKQEWISVDERLPEEFVSVLGYMTDAGNFPPVRECYKVGGVFFFPALGDRHPISHWMPIPEAPKGE